MALVTSKTKAEHDKKHMEMQSGHKESSEKVEHTYYHPLNKTGDIKAYLVGSKVKTETGEHGEVAHVRHGGGTDPHLYKLSSLKNVNERLESGNYIPHTRVMPVSMEEEQHERAKSHPKYEKLKSEIGKRQAMDVVLQDMNNKQ